LPPLLALPYFYSPQRLSPLLRFVDIPDLLDRQAVLREAEALGALGDGGQQLSAQNLRGRVHRQVQLYQIIREMGQGYN
jgi:hypothetical protein